MTLAKVVLAALGFTAFLAAGPALAQEYPTKPIRLIAPFPPGGGTDITARMVADALTRQLGQQVVVENRAGAGGTLGTTHVANSEPDGYTLLWTSVDNYTLGPSIRPNLPYKVEDLTFVARLAENGSTFAVTSKLPVTTLAEFVTYMKAHPKEVRYGSNSVGGAPHFTMVLFQEQAGVEMTQVAYQGVAPAMTDLLAGRLEIVPLTPTTVMPYINSDKLRLLTITQETRNPLFPDLPTIKELGYPAAAVSVWYAMTGPKGLPENVQQRLQKAIAGVAEDPEVKKIMNERGLTPALLYGEDLRKLVFKELAQWKEIAVKNNIKPE